MKGKCVTYKVGVKAFTGPDDGESFSLGLTVDSLAEFGVTKGRFET